MNRVKKGLDNQAIGLLPLLLFMFLDNYFSYLLSFIIGVTFCFVCIFLFQVLSKDKVYQFMLLPSEGTVKKTNLKDLESARKIGLVAINLDDKQISFNLANFFA